MKWSAFLRSGRPTSLPFLEELVVADLDAGYRCSRVISLSASQDEVYHVSRALDCRARRNEWELTMPRKVYRTLRRSSSYSD